MGLHIGIIMDGNGRWAQARGLARTQGHREGLKVAKQIVKAASDMKIGFLTLYVFSTENWKRTADEIGFIMGLVRQYLKSDFNFCRENHIRVRHAGDLSRLPPDIAKDIADVCRDTESFTGMQVILALNYGGRDEIVRAVNRALAGTSAKEKEIEINETVIAGHLDNPDIPDPDLIIRTAGELRTSNFLLWESAYSEYYISKKLWPDWSDADLAEAIENFQKRERRYGGAYAVSDREYHHE
ncbi:MAG: di-trans,poly-cis-decaprenylcistransferase [Treponema sp.]|jgi:undecaprenyl diphosphate synthase|nr:di-trans,poly-cis-decaprenylcistransferase [Treponema sp.]